MIGLTRTAAVRHGVPPAEAEVWKADLRGRTGDGDYFFCVNRFLFLATRPPAASCWPARAPSSARRGSVTGSGVGGPRRSPPRARHAPRARVASCCRSSTRRILPVSVRGSWATNSIFRGYL